MPIFKLCTSRKATSPTPDPDDNGEYLSTPPNSLNPRKGSMMKYDYKCNFNPVFVLEPVIVCILPPGHSTTRSRTTLDQ